jgi:DNA repair protein SbcC/Rad50
MKLLKIELKGFLSYYGHKNETGKIEPVVIDFQGSPLWLIHGVNGSGKSSLFDAITFALYKQHRGGGKTFHHLVHDVAENDVADVKLEFELDSQRYLVHRTINRKKKRSITSEVWGVVCAWTGTGWKPVPETENKIEDWIKQNLKISYDAFVSAVVLRQGKSDTFLQLEASERRKLLLDLLDLKIYEGLGKGAIKQKNIWKSKLVESQEALASCQLVTELEILAQNQAVTDVEEVWEGAKRAQDSKKNELTNTQLVEKLMLQVRQHQEQQQENAILLKKSEEIRSKSRRYSSLKEILPQINHLWQNREDLARETEQVRITSETILLKEMRTGEIARGLKALRDCKEPVIQEVADLTSQMEELKSTQKNLAEQLQNIERTEGFEAKILSNKAELDPYLFLLDASEQIERNTSRYRELNQAIPKLRKLIAEREKLEHDCQQIVPLKEEISKLEEKLEAVQNEQNLLSEAQDVRRTQCEEIRDTLRQCKSTIESITEKLEHRHQINHAQECPTCGSQLDTPEAEDRLAQEQSLWEAELSRLTLQKEDLSEKFELMKGEGLAAKDVDESMKKEIRTIEQRIADLIASLRFLEKSVDTQQNYIENLRQEAGQEQLENLNDLQSEMDCLAEALNDQRKFEAAKQVEIAVTSKIKVYQDELTRLPDFSGEERQNVRREAQGINGTILLLEQQQEILKKQLEVKESDQKTLELEEQKLQSEIQAKKTLLESLGDRRKYIEQTIIQCQRSIEESWRSHPALENKAVLNALEQEKQELATIESEEHRLNEAEQRNHELEGAIATLNSQLTTIPIEHRRPSEAVQQELDQASTSLQQAERKVQEERDKLRELTERQKIYAEKYAHQQEVSNEHRYYKKLEEALGSKGLQAEVVKRAQGMIKDFANKTLGRLSNETWQVDLQESKDGKALEILARDLRSPGLPVRQFEYLSGGEKFRVAISIAIAIGQATCGGRTVDTLVIDEGFGALDEVNRDLLVQELRRLSDEVLQGGQVIVVSHQEDICEEFAHRYRISKDENGHGQIELNPLHA